MEQFLSACAFIEDDDAYFQTSLKKQANFIQNLCTILKTLFRYKYDNKFKYIKKGISVEIHCEQRLTFR